MLQNVCYVMQNRFSAVVKENEEHFKITVHYGHL